MAEQKKMVMIKLKKNYLGDFADKKLEVTESRAKKLVEDGIADYCPRPESGEPIDPAGPTLPKMSTEQALGKGKK